MKYKDIVKNIKKDENSSLTNIYNHIHRIDMTDLEIQRILTDIGVSIIDLSEDFCYENKWCCNGCGKNCRNLKELFAFYIYKDIKKNKNEIY